MLLIQKFLIGISWEFQLIGLVILIIIAKVVSEDSQKVIKIRCVSHVKLNFNYARTNIARVGVCFSVLRIHKSTPCDNTVTYPTLVQIRFTFRGGFSFFAVFFLSTGTSSKRRSINLSVITCEM